MIWRTLATASLVLPLTVAAQQLSAPERITLGGNVAFGPSWIEATAESPSSTPSGYSSMGSFQYQFQISGPEHMDVPITVDYYVNAHAQIWASDWIPGASGSATIAISDWIGTYRYAEHTGRYGLGRNGSDIRGLGHGRFDLELQSNSSYRVSMTVVALTASPSLIPPGYRATAWAYADPYIAIDPDFLSEHPGYSIAFSPGVVNAVTVVPEPATAALLAGGLLALAARRRRSALADSTDQ